MKKNKRGLFLWNTVYICVEVRAWR